VLHTKSNLFAIDREAREAQLDHAARHRLRQEKAPPLLDQIREHLLATSKTVLPRSAAGKACSYTLALSKKLTCFRDHPQLELSNNLAENSMRPVAMGRKNWIHIGGEQAGPRVAAILSVVESCRRLKLPRAITWPMSCPALLTRPSSASPRSLLLHGPPDALPTTCNPASRPPSTAWLAVRIPYSGTFDGRKIAVLRSHTSHKTVRQSVSDVIISGLLPGS
jgi:hypothetical protein